MKCLAYEKNFSKGELEAYLKEGNKLITYLATTYNDERVTGKYVKVEGCKPNFRFKVFETIGANGQGRTIKEYLTSGEELSQEFKERCIKSKTTEKLT